MTSYKVRRHRAVVNSEETTSDSSSTDKDSGPRTVSLLVEALVTREAPHVLLCQGILDSLRRVGTVTQIALVLELGVPRVLGVLED